jgi:signal peptidase II
LVGAADFVKVRTMNHVQNSVRLSSDIAARATSQEAPMLGVSSFTRRFFWFVALAIVGSTLDLWTKHLVFTSPRFFHGDEWWLWNDHIGIQKSLNEGALFGMGQGKVAIFALFSVVAGVAIPTWLFWFRAAEDLWLTTILGVIMGGVIGNFYDRMGFHGMHWDAFDPQRAGESIYAVRDWILFQASDRLVWPNFNIADSLLVVGAIALFMRSLAVSEPSE